jgi:fatty-acyl-CoA synthase
MAWVILKDRQSATPEEMTEYCRGQIATFKISRYGKFLD